jgi:hypothetical protein
MGMSGSSARCGLSATKPAALWQVIRDYAGPAAIVAAVVGEDVALGAVLADAGYWLEANAATETADCRLLIATQKEHRQRASLGEAPPPRNRIPKALTPRQRQRMDRKLRTKPGRALYRLRGPTVEPVFGHVGEQQGTDRFMMRGLEACRGEWKLHAATHNAGDLLCRRETRRNGRSSSARAAPSCRPLPRQATAAIGSRRFSQKFCKRLFRAAQN